MVNGIVESRLPREEKNSLDHRNFSQVSVRSREERFHNGGGRVVYARGDQSNRYRGIPAVPGRGGGEGGGWLLVVGNSILCASLFFNQCYRPVGNSIIKG